jgi:hypothetical protein
LLPEIRAVLEQSDVAVIDATEDHALAAEAFSQAATRLGASGAVMYSERMDDGVELFVRSRGAPMVLGPLEEAEWEGVLNMALHRERKYVWKKAA